MAALIVHRAGLLTTVQDLGRWGYQHVGIPVAGAMDAYSHRLANRLVGNDDARATLEVTLVGPELESRGPVVCAVAGAEFELLVDGRPVGFGRPFDLPKGSRLRFGDRRAGARAALAVRGGFEVPPLLGSRATSVVAELGPFGGRPLRPGDLLPVGVPPGRAPHPSGEPLALPRGGARLRVIAGPQERHFTAETLVALFGRRFVVSPQSNRMGYRLDGEPLACRDDVPVLSEATPAGTVQVPASGQPILLMADRQTTGGYPKIATVITADLPRAAQLAPGDWIEFVRCTSADARAALVRQERRLAGARE